MSLIAKTPENSGYESEDDLCPLCVEEMDISDKNFIPCPCGYRVCMWCWHHIKENLNGLCPACRTPYDDDPHAFAAVDRDQVVKNKKEKKLKKVDRKGEKTPVDKRSLQNVRVIQRNLVYVIGLPLSIASEEDLRRGEYFGQYGRILKVVVNHNHGAPPKDPRYGSASAYVTFAHKEDAKAAIQSVDGFNWDGRLIRASFGTTKYCNNFLRNLPCTNPECLYLHELGDSEDRFTKEEIQTGASKSESSQFSSTTIIGEGGPSGTGKKVANPLFPPPVFDAPKKGSLSAALVAPSKGPLSVWGSSVSTGASNFQQLSTLQPRSNSNTNLRMLAEMDGENEDRVGESEDRVESLEIPSQSDAELTFKTEDPPTKVFLEPTAKAKPLLQETAIKVEQRQPDSIPAFRQSQHILAAPPGIAALNAPPGVPPPSSLPGSSPVVKPRLSVPISAPKETEQASQPIPHYPSRDASLAAKTLKDSECDDLTEPMNCLVMPQHQCEAVKKRTESPFLPDSSQSTCAPQQKLDFSHEPQLFVPKTTPSDASQPKFEKRPNTVGGFGSMLIGSTFSDIWSTDPLEKTESKPSKFASVGVFGGSAVFPGMYSAFSKTETQGDGSTEADLTVNPFQKTDALAKMLGITLPPVDAEYSLAFQTQGQKQPGIEIISKSFSESQTPPLFHSTYSSSLRPSLNQTKYNDAPLADTNPNFLHNQTSNSLQNNFFSSHSNGGPFQQSSHLYHQTQAPMTQNSYNKSLPNPESLHTGMALLQKMLPNVNVSYGEPVQQKQAQQAPPPSLQRVAPYGFQESFPSNISLRTESTSSGWGKPHIGSIDPAQAFGASMWTMAPESANSNTIISNSGGWPTQQKNAFTGNYSTFQTNSYQNTNENEYATLASQGLHNFSKSSENQVHSMYSPLTSFSRMTGTGF